MGSIRVIRRKAMILSIERKYSVIKIRHTFIEVEIGSSAYLMEYSLRILSF
jgi:hypothetical protein